MYVKTLFPSAVNLDCTLIEIIDDALKCDFFGYWFDPIKEFTSPKEEIKALIKRKHIVAMGMELPLEFRKDERTFIEGLTRLEEYAQYASFIGIRRAQTWISPAHASLSYSQNFALHVSRLRKTLDVLKDYDISLGLEFQSPKSLRVGKKYWFIHSLDGALSLLSAINRPNAGLIMDSWHWTLSGADKDDFNALDGDMITAVHINDAPSGLNENEYMDLERELPCTTGVIEIGEFLRRIEDIGYSGPVIVEPFCDKLNNLDVKQNLAAVSHSMDMALLEMRRGI